MTIKITVPDLSKKLAQFQKGGAGYDTVLRTVATSLLGDVKNRIHEDGKAADGSQIGTYSKGYMVVRTNSYKGNLQKVIR